MSSTPSFRALWTTALAAAALLWAIPAFWPAEVGSSGDVSAALGSGRVAWAALIVFGGGLLTSLTPCVYPLVPITLGALRGEAGASKSRVVLRTSAYILGLALVFTTLGVVAAKSGQAFGSFLGSTWVGVGLAVFLALMAASMFGAFELALPERVAKRLSTVGGGGVWGALAMGGAAGFLAAPCTGPVLTGLLTYVATVGSVTMGAGLLFIYALGVGAPFFALGVFSMRLPRSGPWMEWVKSALGVLLLSLAIGYLRDAVPAAKSAVQWATALMPAKSFLVAALVLAVLGVLLGALHRSFHGDARERFLKSLGVAVLVFALVFRGFAATPSTALARWDLSVGSGKGDAAQFERVLAQAKAEGRPVLIDFFADWCAACLELDRHTYPDPNVANALKTFVTIKVDGTQEVAWVEGLYEKFGVEGLPTVVLVRPDGTVAEDRVLGFLPPGEFVGKLSAVGRAQAPIAQ
ncbi:MAG: protein-disulfide reductase DsbD family protein [Myxococcaceae bacterium]